MRIRRLDASGDMTFGRSQANFWINQPEGVGQLVMTRLRLNLGEWFADTTQGTPWATEVLGERTQATRDVVVRSQVLATVGVRDIALYGSRMDPDTRTWTAAMTIDTLYGVVQLATLRLPGALPPLPAPAMAGGRDFVIEATRDAGR